MDLKSFLVLVKLKFVLLLTICIFTFKFGLCQIYAIESSSVQFISEAPLEIITATSTEAKGLIDFEKNTFAITIDLKSFMGFNSPLQKEHFNENYVESDVYPMSTFKGKIIEPAMLSEEGDKTIRAKGLLTIHGQTKEHIIPAVLSINEQIITLRAKFYIDLSNYNISIPRIVKNKISETIQIIVYAELVPFNAIENKL